MFYITGDTHGNFHKIRRLTSIVDVTNTDIMVILGDVGLNYFGDSLDLNQKRAANTLGITLFCIHGNHEMRPTDIRTYIQKEFCGGIVWYEKEFPNILFAKDGEIYRFGDFSCIVIGGAYSVDKYSRLMGGYAWFANEQPSDEIKAYAENQLLQRDNKIDIVLSHTCPLKYEPRETFLSGIDESSVDKSTEEWLDKIEDSVSYQKWYCGHYHTDKSVDKVRFMFEDIEELVVSVSQFDDI